MGFIRNDAGSTIPEFGGEAFPWIGGDAQTLRNFIRRDAPAPPPSQRVILDLDDGDQLLAAYHEPDYSGQISSHKSLGPRGQNRGCVIAVHGLNGCMDAAHIMWLTRSMLAAGWAVLRVNMRGAGPARPLAKGTYNAGAGADLLPFVAWAKQRHPSAPLFMMTHSLGGTAALNMALDFPDEASALAGLITIGSPLDMVATSKQFHARRNWPYIRYMLGGLQDIAASVPGIDPALVKIASEVKSIYEFDDKLTAPMAGYADADAYYRGTSVHHRLADLSLPTLILQASNDPWIPAGPCLDQPVFKRRKTAPSTGKNISIVVTKGGGHVGFHDAKRNWHIRATQAWMNANI